MARYFQSTSTYNPYSLDELMKVPQAIASQARAEKEKYEQYANEYAKIKALAGNNQEATDYLKDYEDKINSVADSMNGYYSGDMSNEFATLRNMYRNKVIPLGTGIEAYNAYMRERNADPTAIGGNHGLMDFVNNPMIQKDWVSGNEIMKRAQMMSAGEAQSKIPQVVGRSNGMLTVQSGFNQNEIMNAFGDDATGSLAESVRSIRAMIPNYDNMSDADKASINSSIASGIAANSSIKQMNDPTYRPELWYNMSKQKDSEDQIIYGLGYDPSKMSRADRNRVLGDYQMKQAEAKARAGKDIGYSKEQIYGTSETSGNRVLYTNGDQQRIPANDKVKIEGREYSQQMIIDKKGNITRPSDDGFKNKTAGHTMVSTAYHHKFNENGKLVPEYNKDLYSKNLSEKQRAALKEVAPMYTSSNGIMSHVFLTDEGDVVIYS